MMNLPWDWLILGLFIAGLIYTLIVVREEQDSYLTNSRAISFRHFQFQIPSWWGVDQFEDRIVFERKDTRYDWVAEISWIPETEEDNQKEIEDLFKVKIKALEIEFDLDSTVIHNPTDFLCREEVETGQLEIVRIEGTATQSGIERVYYDAFLIRDKAAGGHLFCTSRSSILNGLVEGPYFEQAINNFGWQSA